MRNDLPLDDDAVIRASAALVAAGVAVGELVALDAAHACALVALAGASPGRALRARSVVDLQPCHIGRELLLAFENADPGRPVVLGILQGATVNRPSDLPGGMEVEADGQRLLLSARESMVLRCGAASITLTRAGKVLIEGHYVRSRASGVNRVQGGSVQLN